MTEINEANGHSPADGSGAVIPLPRTPQDALPPGVWPGPADTAQDPDETAVEGAPVPVDADPRTVPDPSALPWTVPSTARPVVPAWVLDAAQRKAAAAWALRWARHATLFHLARVPKYAARACWYLPRGLGRAIVSWVRWTFDHDAHELRLDLIQKREAQAYHQAVRHRDERVRNRLLASVISSVGAGVGLTVVVFVFPLTAPLLAGLGGGVLLWSGRPIGKPFLFDHTVTPASVVRLTSDVVARALGALGNSELRKAVERKELAFTTPITRDGAGWRAELDLPHGVTAVDVIEKRKELSSGLRRPLGCVWPEPVDEEHSGRLVLWVGDRPLSKSKPAPYPMLERGSTSMFNPLPFGTDQRGRPVTLTLMFASAAVGAQPRMGKTFSVRLLALGAALDPSCELHIYDGKGMGDYVMFEPVAHWFGSGSREQTLVSLRDDLKALKEEVNRRAELLTKLTRQGKCKEGKATPELAKVKAYGLHPILVLLDECHLAFDTGKGKAGALGDEITEAAEYLVRVGPAAGVTLVASTQRPDADSLPSGIRANVQLRFCLRVADQGTNDMVLGTSAYKNGVRATEFALGDKGIGYLSGEGAVPAIVWTHYVDADGATSIVKRARVLREEAGTVTGMAAGIEPPRQSDPGELLADVLAVIGDEEQIWSEAICARLAEANPGRYAGWDAAALGKALRALGVPTGQTWWTPPGGKATNRNGVTRKQIADALTAARAGER